MAWCIVKVLWQYMMYRSNRRPNRFFRLAEKPSSSTCWNRFTSPFLGGTSSGFEIDLNGELNSRSAGHLVLIFERACQNMQHVEVFDFSENPKVHSFRLSTTVRPENCVPSWKFAVLDAQYEPEEHVCILGCSTSSPRMTVGVNRDFRELIVKIDCHRSLPKSTHVKAVISNVFCRTRIVYQ